MKIKIQHIACLSVLMLLSSTNCTDKGNTKSITDSNAILQEMTDKKDIQLPLITVVEEGYTKAVKYYMKQVR